MAGRTGQPSSTVRCRSAGVDLDGDRHLVGDDVVDGRAGPGLLDDLAQRLCRGVARESPVWRHWLVELSRRFRLVRYDERGCGLSDWDVGRFTLDDWVDDLATVVDAVGLERFPLLGLSQGGPVAVAYAVRHPERVSHLVLLGAFAQGRRKRARSPDELELNEARIDMVRLAWGRPDPTYRQMFVARFLPEGTQEEWREFDELQRRSTSPENAWRFVDEFSNIDVTDLATNVTAPPSS